jgi:rhodanese-related sulfurtransferase
LTVACTGTNEKALRRLGTIDYQKTYLPPGQHVSYYPGATPIHLKLLFARGDGSILGAQAVGQQGAEKRIDVIAMAIQNGATVFDLEEAELCYAPQFGAAKDPVNMAGMIAANVLRGDVSLAEWEALPGTEALLVDVRQPEEFAAGHIAGAINLPLPELRSRMTELPKDREIWLNCGVGQRSYNAARILSQQGFAVKNLSGGFTTYKHFGTRLEASLGVSSS